MYVFFILFTLCSSDVAEMVLVFCCWWSCRLSLGDDRVPFCLQSCGKCLNYAFVLQDNGREEVGFYRSIFRSGLHLFKRI